MLKIRFNPIKQEIWFSTKPTFLNAFLLVNYKQSKSKQLGYVNQLFHTVLINLNSSNEVIKKDFKSNYRNEINKAMNLNIKFKIENNFLLFKVFYNSFAKSKGLSFINDNFSYYLPNVKISKAVYNGEVLVMHMYIVDKQIKRVRLLYSATSMKFEDKKIIGFANKILHYEDMMFFKENKFEVYDLGGINIDSNDSVIQGINRFKKGFGGEIIEEYNLISYPLYLLKKLK